MTEEPITEAKIRQLLAEGKLPDLFRWHHYKQLVACAQAIEDALTRLEEEGFHPFEVYYALRQHFFFARFGLEDQGLGKGADMIDAEMGRDLYEHRKKYSPEYMREHHGEKTRPEGSSEEIKP